MQPQEVKMTDAKVSRDELVQVIRKEVITRCENCIRVAELQYLLGEHYGPFGKDPELGDALKTTKGALLKLKTAMERQKPRLPDIAQAYDAVMREIEHLAYLMHERTTD